MFFEVSIEWIKDSKAHLYITALYRVRLILSAIRLSGHYPAFKAWTRVRKKRTLTKTTSTLLPEKN